MKKIAVVTGRGLGDALLFRVLSYNLEQAGFHVTTFSTVLCELKSWFPHADIRPFPEHDLSFNDYDEIIAFDHSIMEGQKRANLIFVKENEFAKTKTFVENMRLFCENKLKLKKATENTGIQIPSHLKWRKFSKRVVLHPTSTDIQRNWPKRRFINLCLRLQTAGYEGVFCVASKEQNEWPSAPFFANLTATAEFIYESGYMIGNNSGIGHLASLLNIPTLSLFARKSYSYIWRPGFSKNGKVVTPPSFLIGSRLKQKYWKILLKERRVFRAFRKQVKKLGEEH